MGSPKIFNFWGEAEARVAFMPQGGILCDRVAEREAKTVLDLLHSLGVEDQDIRFDNFGG